jgi:hypothetical protein
MLCGLLAARVILIQDLGYGFPGIHLPGNLVNEISLSL